MKTSFLIISIFTWAAILSVSADSRHTADFIRIEPKLDEKVILDVASVNYHSRAENEAYGFLTAWTYDTRDHKPGGQIFVIADKEEIAKLVKRFGSRPDLERNRAGRVQDIDTLRMIGILRQTETKVLYVDLTDDGVPTEELASIRKAITAKTVAGKNGKGKGKAAVRTIQARKGANN